MENHSIISESEIRKMLDQIRQDIGTTKENIKTIKDFIELARNVKDKKIVIDVCEVILSEFKKIS